MNRTKVLPHIIVLTSLLLSWQTKADIASSLNTQISVEDSLNRMLDTMARDDNYFKTLTSIELMNLNSPRLLHYAKLKETEAKKQNLLHYVCESYSDRAIYYSNLKNTDSFYYWKNQMDPLALKIKNYNLYFFLGNAEVGLHIKNGKIESAIQTAKKLYETAKEYDSTDGLIASNMSIGLAMKGARRYEEAYASYETALKLIEESKFAKQSWKLNVYSNLTLLCDNLKKYPQGLEYNFQKEKLINEIRDERIGETNDHSFMLNQWSYIILDKAYFNIKLNNTEKAWRQLQSIYAYYPELSKNTQMQYRHTVAEYYEAAGNYRKALSELDSSYTYYIGTDPESMIQLMEEKARLLDKTGAHREAVKLYQDLIILKDSINSKWIDAQVGELRTIYDTDHLKLINSQLELKNKHTQIQTFFISLGLSILALICISLLYVRILRIKKKLEISEEQLLSEKEQLKIAKEKAEEARDLAQKAERKESFFANMSHEIRTPLNAIVGFSNLLVSEEELSKEERSLFIKMINQNCEQLLKLVNDVLDLSRMESGKMSFSFENHNLTELMNEVYTTNQMLVPQQLKFLKSLPEHPVIAHVDKMRLKQVLFNFINNAIKFTPEGYIRIGYKLEVENKTVSIFVEDTGRGIPEEHQRKIFDRFYKQVDTDQGTGLGLSISTIIAEKQGGHITLVSKVGKGSCFTIVLPFDEKLNKNVIP